MNKIDYDIIIVGAGAAGMTAAIYGVRSGKSILLIEEKMYGGQIINTPQVENYPGIETISGASFATNLYNQAKGLGAEYLSGKVTEIKDCGDTKEVTVNDNSYKAESVIIATGARNRTLNVPGEIELTGKGVSYCATCDGMFFRNRDVAVVGGGNTALEDALFLSDYCNKVYIIHRRETFRGEKQLEESLRAKENVVFLLNRVVEEIQGKETLESIIVKEKDGDKSEKISINGLFIAVGQVPDNDVFSNVVELDEYGYIAAGEDCKTNCEGVYAAGDCRTKSIRQLTTATSDGAVAALGACSYINTKS
ncbi:MAG: thioredoxin-disulfide reductase [Eubacterium sp.]|jgi:thioredoxin reductase (NADPH)|nr:thioredoxin-disulfide reductase [Eubacterium sp.]